MALMPMTVSTSARDRDAAIDTARLSDTLCTLRSVPYKDPVAQAQAQRQWHLLHKERTKVQRKQRQEWVRKQKEKPCLDCGTQYPYYVMQFDHREGTNKSFKIARSKLGFKKLEAEIAKCDVVCANCHAERTWQCFQSGCLESLVGSTNKPLTRKERRKAYVKAHRQRRQEWVRKQKEKPCLDCGTQYPYYVMQFDHRDGDRKLLVLSNGRSWVGAEKLKIEILKCDVVCANCHAGRTWQRITVLGGPGRD